MKKTIAIIALVVLVAVASVLGTMAYLTSTAKVENTFTMGDVKIKLDETDVNNPEGDRVTKNDYEVYPETKNQGLFHQIQKEVTFCGLPHGADA